MTTQEAGLVVVHEDDALLVLNKQAGLVCHPTKGDAYSSLVGRVRLYLGPDATAHLVNRLDRETSGLVLIVKKDDAARAIRRLWEQAAVEKRYWAIVHGHLGQDEGIIDASLGKDISSEVAIKDCVRADGSAALTQFWVRRRFVRGEGDFSLLEVRLVTGRKHQIRIHLAHLGHPIVGDKLYGGDEKIYLAFVRREMTDLQQKQMILENQALHAYSLRFELEGHGWAFFAEPEEAFQRFAGISKVDSNGISIVSNFE